LRAGIDQEELVHSDAPVRRARNAIVHDGAIRACSGNGGKGDILERARVAAEAFECSDCVDFSQLAGRRFLVEPRQELRHRHAIALVSGAAADDFGMVLRGLQRSDRIRSPLRLAAVVDDQPR
jgi:hypothetical protein